MFIKKVKYILLILSLALFGFSLGLIISSIKSKNNYSIENIDNDNSYYLTYKIKYNIDLNCQLYKYIPKPQKYNIKFENIYDAIKKCEYQKEILKYFNLEKSTISNNVISLYPYDNSKNIIKHNRFSEYVDLMFLIYKEIPNAICQNVLIIIKNKNYVLKTVIDTLKSNVSLNEKYIIEESIPLIFKE